MLNKLFLIFFFISFNIFTCSRKKTDLKLVEDEIKKVNPNIVFSSIEADLSQKEGCNKFVEFVKRGSAFKDHSFICNRK